MKNTYDILVNFKKQVYEFYEWNKKDNINHIKVIPTFKVSDKCLYDFINCNLVINKEFLKKIYKKTEVFYGRLIKAYEYACILFNDDIALAFIFDEEGNLIGKSSLLFDEEEDIIELNKKLEKENIKYEIISKVINNKFYTRNENKIIDVLLKYLSEIYNTNKISELKYIYLECFDNDEENYEYAYKKIVSEIENGNFNVIEKIKSLIKVLKK